MNNLGQFLASIKGVEDRGYGQVGRREGNVTPFGVYGMFMEHWAEMAAPLGLAEHDKFDPAAQDAVAAYWGQKYFQRYGDWDMAAAAWYTGMEQTDRAASSSEGIEWFKNDETKKWLSKVKGMEANPEVKNAKVPRAGAQWINPGGAPRGWLSPVAGKSEYSNSFMVPRSNNKTGIHGAIDLYAKTGTPVVAPVGGRVISARTSKIGGHTVRIRGTDGLTYYFAHMNERAVVRNGQKITAGEHLGFVGASGNARGTSPHLHFSIRRGSKLVNPYNYLQGSRNAGNYYSPESADHGAEPVSIREKYTSALDAVSNQIAGGERVDYRTIGEEPQEDNEEEVGAMPKVASPSPHDIASGRV